MKSFFRLTLVFFVSMQLAYSQKTLTGLVSDNDGLPLPGATVLVSGTLTGVTTDFDGNFSINASEGQQLEFSFVGYETATVTVMLYLKLTIVKLRAGLPVMLHVFFLVRPLVFRLPIKVVYLDLEQML
jgi:hypothetical protein